MKGRLLYGVAAIALGLGLAAMTGPAFADGDRDGLLDVSWSWDNDVDWSWDKDKDMKVDVKEWIWAWFNPDGETEVQKVQVFIGDVTAKAVLGGDYVDAEVDVDPCHYSFGCGFGFDFGDWWDKDLVANEDLGLAIQEVTALGVADTIESAFPVYAHEIQVVLGTPDYYVGGDFDLLSLDGGHMPMLDAAEITASATAGIWFDPVEIAVDQQVAAIAGAVSIELIAENAPYQLDYVVNKDDGGDCFFGCFDFFNHGDDYSVYRAVQTNNIVEADITQFAIADVKAEAVAFQDLSAFTNLGNYTGLDPDVPGLVARQTVTAAGLVSSVVNTVKGFEVGN